MSRRFSSNAISILRFSYNQHLVQIYGVDKKEKKHLFRTVVRLEKRFRKKKKRKFIYCWNWINAKKKEKEKSRCFWISDKISYLEHKATETYSQCHDSAIIVALPPIERKLRALRPESTILRVRKTRRRAVRRANYEISAEPLPRIHYGTFLLAHQAIPAY